VAANFVLPVAIIGAIFYGVAGIRHAMQKHRNANENMAMITDLFAALVFCAFLVFTYRVRSGL
jgi:formylmethanofuran dehydrogenase subunit B